MLNKREGFDDGRSGQKSKCKPQKQRGYAFATSWAARAEQGEGRRRAAVQVEKDLLHGTKPRIEHVWTGSCGREEIADQIK